MVEQLKDDELDQVNGGNSRPSIAVYVKNSFNTGSTTTGSIDIDAYHAGVSVTIGSTGGLFVG